MKANTLVVNMVVLSVLIMITTFIQVSFLFRLLLFPKKQNVRINIAIANCALLN